MLFRSTLRELGRSDEALASARQAAACHPDYADAHYSCGLLLHEGGQITEALAAYERALALAPQDPHTLTAKGRALQEQAQTPAQLQAALACYTQALQISPTHPDARAYRQSLLEQLQAAG